MILEKLVSVIKRLVLEIIVTFDLHKSPTRGTKLKVCMMWNEDVRQLLERAFTLFHVADIIVYNGQDCTAIKKQKNGKSHLHEYQHTVSKPQISREWRFNYFRHNDSLPQLFKHREKNSHAGRSAEASAVDEFDSRDTPDAAAIEYRHWPAIGQYNRVLVCVPSDWFLSWDPILD